MRPEGLLPALPSLGWGPAEPGTEPPLAREGLEALDGGVLPEGQGDTLGRLEGLLPVQVEVPAVFSFISRPSEQSTVIYLRHFRSFPGWGCSQ